MKIITIVGARPQFIKAAVVSKKLREAHEEILVHTGQHYDYNMSEVFFQEMEIPKPDYNLGISGGTHGEMTGKMIMEIEKVLVEEKPEGVLLYGDTNSTMAGALAAAKLYLPIYHVEAGGRVGSMVNPEEINRIVTDHVSSKLFCCTQSAMVFLKTEGLSENAYLVGDPMYDAFLYYSRKVGDERPEDCFDLDGNRIELPGSFNYLTCHREENTRTDGMLNEILVAMDSLGIDCIYPVHPRNQEMVRKLCANNTYSHVHFIKPVGYLMSVYLTNHAEKIVTDSGGLQREAYFAKKPCVTIFDHVIWPETMVNKRNQLARPIADDILNKLGMDVSFDNDVSSFGDGNAAQKIVDLIP